MIGHILNVGSHLNDSRLFLRSVRAAIKHKWDRCPSFYLGLLIFCYEDLQDKFEYEEVKNINTVKIRKCVENLTFPEQARSLLPKLWDANITFEEFLKALSKEPKLNFNLDSALFVYKMQGKDAIFGILCQIYTVYDLDMEINVKLIHDLPIVYVPPVSDFVSGVFFPVVVTKYSRYLFWEENEYGVYLIDENGGAIDCARSDDCDCFNDPLYNRLGLVYHSEYPTSPWRICWNWGEIVEAVKFFGGDVLVRGLSEGMLRSDWRRFGVNGLLVVNCFKTKIAGSGSSLKRPNNVKCLKDIEVNCEKNQVGVVNLLGEMVDVKPEGRVVYTNEELEDWFELGRLCKEKIED